MANTQWTMQGGELVAYADVFQDVDLAQADLAVKAEREIVETKAMIDVSFARLAFLLDKFEERGLYKARGYERFKDWAESPEIELGWKVVRDLVRVSRKLAPVLGGSLEEPEVVRTLAEIGVSKARALLPLINDDQGKAKALELVGEILDVDHPKRWRDVIADVKEYNEGPSPIDERRAVIFTAYARRGETHTRCRIVGSDGVAHEQLGAPLLIRNDWWPIWEGRFTRHVEWEE